MAKAKKADSKKDKVSLGDKIKKGCKEAGERVKDSELSDKIILFVGILLIFLALILNFVETKGSSGASIILAVSFINGILGMIMVMLVLTGTKLDAVNGKKGDKK